MRTLRGLLRVSPRSQHRSLAPRSSPRRCRVRLLPSPRPPRCSGSAQGRPAPSGARRPTRRRAGSHPRCASRPHPARPIVSSALGESVGSAATGDHRNPAELDHPRRAGTCAPPSGGRRRHALGQGARDFGPDPARGPCAPGAGAGRLRRLRAGVYRRERELAVDGARRADADEPIHPGRVPGRTGSGGAHAAGSLGALARSLPVLDGDLRDHARRGRALDVPAGDRLLGSRRARARRGGNAHLPDCAGASAHNRLELQVRSTERDHAGRRARGLRHRRSGGRGCGTRGRVGGGVRVGSVPRAAPAREGPERRIASSWSDPVRRRSCGRQPLRTAHAPGCGRRGCDPGRVECRDGLRRPRGGYCHGRCLRDLAALHRAAPRARRGHARRARRLARRAVAAPPGCPLAWRRLRAGGRRRVPDPAGRAGRVRR